MSGRGTERVLDLIEWMSLQIDARSLTEIVTELDLPKSSALMLLRTLVEKSYVTRDLEGRYRLARLPGEHGSQKYAAGTLLRIAHPYLEEAVKQTQESAFIAVLDSAERVTYLNKLLPDREIRYDRDITTTRVAEHVTSGRVLLAGMEKKRLDSYLIDRPPDGDDLETVRGFIEKTRAEGYAVNLEGRIEGAAGMAAPILDHEGRCVAALNIAGPKERIAKEQSRILQTLLITAESISRALASASAHQTTDHNQE